ncbi:zinc finger protein [Turdus rufiventris]|nr:zinc finger protein [Turdus rufiventris]
MTTEDYKKLAPYNIRQKPGDGDQEDLPFSPDEHKKRAEAANSVLRRSAGRERAYVLSAAKKSNGANGLKKTSPGPSWDEAKAAAASPCSPKPGSRSQTSPSLSDTLGKISISAETRNAEDRQELNGKSSLGEVSQRGDGFPEHTETKNGFYPPESAPGYEDRNSSTDPEGSSHHQPYWEETRSRSVAEGSSIPAPEIAHAEECEPRRDRSVLSSQESVPSALEPRPPGPLLQERQSFGGSVPSHRIPAYVDSQVFSTRRPGPDAQGSVYSGSSWYDSARGHGDFSLTAGRDATMPMAQRSHRVPFYMDSLNCNSTRLLSSSNERLCSSHHSSGYQPDSSTAGRGILFVKEYVNTGGFTASPRHGSLVDLSDLERSSYSQQSFLSSAPLLRSSEPLCSYCSREIRDCPKIIIEHLNIHCHEYCFRCGICHKAMGDLLDKIFIHRDIVHCDKCYEKLF